MTPMSALGPGVHTRTIWEQVTGLRRSGGGSEYAELTSARGVTDAGGIRATSASALSPSLTSPRVLWQPQHPAPQSGAALVAPPSQDSLGASTCPR